MTLMPAPRGRRVSEYPELVLVTVAAVVGLTLHGPMGWLVRHQGIDILLVILVFSTALGIEPASLRRVPATWRPLGTALLAGVVVLPAAAWAVAHLVAAGPLRDGVMTAGLAPCEIASVATTAMAGGEVAVAAGLLIGSTMLTVALAGPVLALESRHATIHPTHIIANLLLVVAAPLVVGLAVRAVRAPSARTGSAAAMTSAVSVAALVALVAAEVRFSRSYVMLTIALLAFLTLSAGLGVLIGRGTRQSVGRAILLTTSMRDFAIAAGLAAAAFGPAAAAPLGIYGVTVLVWGTGAAGFLRTRPPSGPAA